MMYVPSPGDTRRHRAFQRSRAYLYLDSIEAACCLLVESRRRYGICRALPYLLAASIDLRLQPIGLPPHRGPRRRRLRPCISASASPCGIRCYAPTAVANASHPFCVTTVALDPAGYSGTLPAAVFSRRCRSPATASTARYWQGSRCS
jgi:hypothetical protein